MHEMDACKDCSMNCMLIHGKKDDSSPVIKSFFKVMIDKRFSDVLYIPPRFAKGLSLAGNEIHVEDTSGRYWTMTLSYANGYLAFGKGWSDFVKDHGINFGDMVIVHQIRDTHFVVQVYGINGCEKLPLPSASNNTKNKRARTCRVSMDIDSGISIDSDVNMDINHGSDEGCSKAYDVNVNISQGIINEGCSEVHLSDSTNGRGVKRSFAEDPCWIVDRDIDPTPKVDYLYEFEMSSRAKHVSENGSVPVKDGGGCTDPVEDNIFSSFEENIIDSAAFDATMRIPCDGDCPNDEEVPGQVFTETCPSTSALSATDHKMNHARTSQEAQTTTLGDRGVANEREEFNLKSVVDERAQVGGGVRISENEQKQFSPQQFGGSVKIASKECKDFNPEGLGGSVRVAKKEPKDFNPGGFAPSGGSVGMGKIEHKDFNPDRFGASVRRVKEEHKEFNPNNFGGIARTVKKEFTEFRKSQQFENSHSPNAGLQENRASSFHPVLKRVKAEAVDFAEPSSPLQIKCLVKSDHIRFLELPRHLYSLGHRVSMGAEETVVLLRDSARRLWPLLYNKEMRVLRTGWKSFREANGIRTGDECVFALENEYQGIFRVDVVRK